MPILGPDIFDPRQVQLIKEYTLAVAKESGGAGAKAADGKQREAGDKKELSDKAKARIEQAKARAAAKKA